MFGNLGNIARFSPGSMLTGGSSPNTTGTNIQASSNPAGGLFGLLGSPSKSSNGGAAFAGAPAPAAMQPTALHESGLPHQPPSGISPQLWDSVLQHLQRTSFGKQQPARPQWEPTPLMMRAQPFSPNRVGGAAFMGI